MIKDRLRIAMLSAHSCPLGKLGAKDTGGMSVYIRELAREMGKRGHVVDIFTRAHDSGHGQIMELGENVRLIHLRAGEDEHIHKLAVYLYLPDFACNLESFRKHNRLKYDIVFSHYWLSAWVGNFLQSWWSVPHIAMFHTLGAVKNAIGIGEDEPELRVETERYLIKNCHRIIAPTEKEKGNIISYYSSNPEKIGVIPCGVNLDLFQPADKEAARKRLGLDGKRCILYVGRLDALKGIDRLLNAMAYIKNGNNLKLIIIGGDGETEYDIELQRLSRELQIQDLVSFQGMVAQEELPPFYNAADVVVIPSYYESCGLVLLESLACGTPVVMTRVGSAESVIRHGETGYVTASNDPQVLAEKIMRVLSRPNGNSESINSVRAAVAGFGWPNVAGAVIKECRNMITEHSSKKG